MRNDAFYMTAPMVMEAREAPMPIMGDDDVLIRLQVLGICGSDLHTFMHGMAGAKAVEYPFILGHEASGIVENVGKNVLKLQKGDRVVMEPGIPCCKCEYCLKGQYHLCPELRFWAVPPYDGCLQNYVVHPADFTFKLPDSVSLREGALVEPLSVGLSAADRGNIRPGETVVILGAGCIGLVTLQAAKAHGAGKVIITDVLPTRLESAKRMGGIPVLASRKGSTEEIISLTGGQGAQVVVDCCGKSQTLQQSLTISRPGGRIVVVGLAQNKIEGLHMSDFIDKELSVISVRRYHNHFPVAISLIANGTVDVKHLISNEYLFKDTPSAFEDCIKNQANIVKGIILC